MQPGGWQGAGLRGGRPGGLTPPWARAAESGLEAPAAVRNLSLKGCTDGKGNAENPEFPCEL